MLSPKLDPASMRKPPPRYSFSHRLSCSSTYSPPLNTSRLASPAVMFAAASKWKLPGRPKLRPFALMMLSSWRNPCTPTVVVEPMARLRPAHAYVAPASRDTDVNDRSRRLSCPVGSPGVNPIGSRSRCWFVRLSVPSVTLADRSSRTFQRMPVERMKRLTHSSMSGRRKMSSASWRLAAPEKKRASPTSKVVRGSPIEAPL